MIDLIEMKQFTSYTYVHTKYAYKYVYECIERW